MGLAVISQMLIKETPETLVGIKFDGEAADIEKQQNEE